MFKYIAVRYVNWSGDDVRDYRQLESDRLTGIYSCAEIPVTNPKRRFDYLMKYFTHLTWHDYLSIITNAHRRGSNFALNFLETLVDTYDLY